MDRTLLCYFGHHKCASTWIISMLYDVSFALGRRLYEKQIVLINDPQAALNERGIDFYICQTSDYQKVKTLNNIRGFHVIRDPRDIIVSGYFSHLHSHPVHSWPELREHRRKLENCSKEEGLFLEMEFDKYFIDHIAGWNYHDPNILEVKYECLLVDPKEKFKSIFEFLYLHDEGVNNKRLTFNGYANRIFNRLSLDYRMKGNGLNNDFIGHLLTKNHFQKLSNGRSHGEENQRSHYRKGVAGDWKNHLTDKHKIRFKELFGDLVVRLGYEKDNNW